MIHSMDSASQQGTRRQDGHARSVGTTGIAPGREILVKRVSATSKFLEVQRGPRLVGQAVSSMIMREVSSDGNR